MRAAGDRPRSWAAAALVGLAAGAVHARSIGFDFTYLDDRDLVVDDYAFLVGPGSVLRAFTRSYMSVVDGQHPYYRPLVTASYVVDARWSGLRPFGYHATNVLLHIVASVLIYALLRRYALGTLVTLLAALAFALHPALAAAVAWVPGRNDLLLAVFAFSSWLFFWHDARHPSWPHRFGHLAFFGLSLLTKESALAVPLVCATDLALIEPAIFARFRRSWAALFVACGWCVAIGLRLLARPFSGAASAAEVYGKLPLVFTSFGQLVFPANPSLITVRDDVPLWPGTVAVVAVLVAAFVVPGVRRRTVAAGAATYLLFLLPALLVPGTLIQSTRLYLPGVGLVLGIAEIARALGARERALLNSSFATAVAALAVFTIAYEGTFRDRHAFARSAVDAAPHSPLAHFCLGQSYQIDGADDRALAEYRLALMLGAVHVVHNNIAVIYMASARYDEAERELRQELAVDPRYARAYHNLAIVLRHEGRVEESLQAEQRATSLGP